MRHKPTQSATSGNLTENEIVEFLAERARRLSIQPGEMLRSELREKVKQEVPTLTDVQFYELLRTSQASGEIKTRRSGIGACTGGRRNENSAGPLQKVARAYLRHLWLALEGLSSLPMWAESKAECN